MGQTWPRAKDSSGWPVPTPLQGGKRLLAIKGWQRTTIECQQRSILKMGLLLGALFIMPVDFGVFAMELF